MSYKQALIGRDSGALWGIKLGIKGATRGTLCQLPVCLWPTCTVVLYVSAIVIGWPASYVRRCYLYPRFTIYTTSDRHYIKLNTILYEIK